MIAESSRICVMIGTRCSAGVGNDHKLQSGGMITVLIHPAQVRGKFYGCVKVGSRKPEQSPMTRDDSRVR